MTIATINIIAHQPIALFLHYIQVLLGGLLQLLQVLSCKQIVTHTFFYQSKGQQKFESDIASSSTVPAVKLAESDSSHNRTPSVVRSI